MYHEIRKTCNSTILLTTKVLVTMNTKVFIESYEAPQVEIIEVAVEKGFGVSGGITTEVLGDDIEW